MLNISYSLFKLTINEAFIEHYDNNPSRHQMNLDSRKGF